MLKYLDKLIEDYEQYKELLEQGNSDCTGYIWNYDEQAEAEYGGFLYFLITSGEGKKILEKLKEESDLINKTI